MAAEIGNMQGEPLEKHEIERHGQQQIQAICHQADDQSRERGQYGDKDHAETGHAGRGGSGGNRHDETKIPGVMWEKRLLYRTGVAIFWPASAQTGTITPHSDLNTGRFMQISKHKVVAIDYTLTGPDGAVLDSSEGREPLAYLHGAGNIIAGLEAELEGKTRGDKLDVTVAPAEGYGERNEALIQQVPRSMFEGVDKIEPGMRFNAMSDA